MNQMFLNKSLPRGSPLTNQSTVLVTEFIQTLIYQVRG